MARRARFDLDADAFDTGPAPVARPVPAQAAQDAEPASSGASSSDLLGGIFGTGGAGSIPGGVLSPGWGGGVYQPVNYNDFIVGTAGADYIDAGLGDDLVYGGDGDDLIWGGAGHDTLVAGNGHDFVDGGDGADWIQGGDGNDKLFGGLGNDRLEGGAGDDQIMGMEGADVMIGGAGADKFIVGQAYYTAAEQMNRPLDTIVDFELPSEFGSGDKIALSQALLNTDFFQRFGWGASAHDAFAQGYVILGQHGYQGQPGFGTKVWIDTNGAAAGGNLFAVADIAGLGLAQLNTPDHGLFII